MRAMRAWSASEQKLNQNVPMFVEIKFLLILIVVFISFTKVVFHILLSLEWNVNNCFVQSTTNIKLLKLTRMFRHMRMLIQTSQLHGPFFHHILT